MRLLFALLLLLASPALAQRQPANVSTLPANTPQEFDLLDNTGKWIPFGTASGGVFLNAGREISPVIFGAKCDGVTDDTVALQKWVSVTTAGAHLVVPGVCVFKSQLVFPRVDNVTLEGASYASKLLYAGASTTLDPIIQIGVRPNHGCSTGVNGWSIRNLVFMSSTVMTAGDGLRINGGCLMRIESLDVGGNFNGSNSNFYNAVRIEGGNTIHVHGFIFRGSNDALALSGDLDAQHFQIEASLLQGQLVNSKVGLHLCGGAGGGIFDSMDVIGNGTNVLIDRSCVNLRQTQELFGAHFMSDVTSGSPGIGVHISDPGGSSTFFIYRGWLASATNQCFLYDAGTPDSLAAPPSVVFAGATIGVCHAPSGLNGGIENQNAYAKISISGSRFFASQIGKPTIFNSVGAVPIAIQGLSASGDANFNILGAWVGSYLDGTGINRATPFNALSAPAITATGSGADYQWRPVGGTQPTDSKNWDFFENGATGDLALRVIDDGFANANAYVQFIRGTGYSLTGAKATFTVPVSVPQYTIATLPSCVSGQAGMTAYVVNGQASPPFLGAVSTTGSTIAPVFCTGGSGWVYH